MTRYQKHESEQVLAEKRILETRERQSYSRAPLNIITPIVTDEELRKKWFGMPPRKIDVPRRNGTVLF